MEKEPLHKKKSLGQHFLRGRTHLSAVADAAHIEAGERVLEVGPGEGTLTEVLLDRGAHVVALEKDFRLIEFLETKFAGKDLEVIEGDALDFEPLWRDYVVVGNIPYYITGALLKKFLTARRQPKRLVFLMQKEVAERIARSKKESVLSLAVKAYGTPKYIKTVPRGAFSPPPKVDSAILQVDNISRSNFINDEHEAKFFELVKKAFGGKRKVLKNTIGATGALASKRPEDVHLKEWLELTK